MKALDLDWLSWIQAGKRVVEVSTPNRMTAACVSFDVSTFRTGPPFGWILRLVSPAASLIVRGPREEAVLTHASFAFLNRAECSFPLRDCMTASVVAMVLAANKDGWVWLQGLCDVVGCPIALRCGDYGLSLDDLRAARLMVSLGACAGSFGLDTTEEIILNDARAMAEPITRLYLALFGSLMGTPGDCSLSITAPLGVSRRVVESKPVAFIICSSVSWNGRVMTGAGVYIGKARWTYSAERGEPEICIESPEHFMLLKETTVGPASSRETLVARAYLAARSLTKQYKVFLVGPQQQQKRPRPASYLFD